VTTVSHKGFRIVARPYQLHATGLWTVEVEIRRKGRLRAFSGATRYPTEEQATAESIDLGRRIIGGHEPGCSIDSLR
jgi:hypothetical protein